MEGIDSGTLPGYQAQHPTARVYASELAQRGINPMRQRNAVQLPQGIAPNQINPATGMSPQQQITNASMDVRDGFAPPPKPRGQVGAMRGENVLPEHKPQARERAIAMIRSNRAARESVGTPAPGIGIGPAPAPDMQKQTIAAMQEAERAAKANKPPALSLNQIDSLVPPDPKHNQFRYNQESGQWEQNPSYVPEQDASRIARGRKARKIWAQIHSDDEGEDDTPRMPQAPTPPTQNTIGGPGAMPQQGTYSWGVPREQQQAPAQESPPLAPEAQSTYRPLTPEDYMRIPKGATYIHPDGTRRVKK